MTLTVRSATVSGATTKGSALTHAELDENFNHLSQSSNHTFTQSGSGAVSQTVQAKLRQQIASIDDFGGTAGAAAATVDAAVTAAITAVGDYGAIYIPKGSRTHNGISTNALGLTIVGAGKGASIMQLASGATAASLRINTTTDFKNPFTIQGVDFLGVATSSHGLHIEYASVVNIQDCRFNNHGGSGIYAVETTNMTLVSVECRDNAADGLATFDTTDAVTAIGCDFFSNDGWGIQINNTGAAGGKCNTAAYVGCAFTQNTSGGIWIRGASTNGQTFTGCYIENNGATQNVKLGESGGGEPHSVSFRGCRFNGASTTAKGIDAFEINAFAVEDCFFEGHTTGAIKMNNSTALHVLRCENNGGYGVSDASGTEYSFDNGRSLIFSGTSAPPTYISSTTTIPSFRARAMASQSAALIELLNSSGTAITKFRANGSLLIGTATPGAEVDINVARNDTTGGMVRIEQQGNGAAGAAIFNALADGTGASCFAAFFRSKGTGALVRHANATEDVFGTYVNADVVCGGSALATNANNGFFYIRGGAGAPTGTPTSYTGRVAMYYDTTNNALYVYNGAWKSVALT
jgi:hypothetical protein